MKMRERPISRILSRGLPLMDDHSSDHAVTDTATAANPDLLERKKLRRHARRHRSTRSLFGVAPGGACHAAAVASRAVGSYPTVSPLPANAPRRTLTDRRFIFCGAFRRVAPPGRYPAPFLSGVRTFLPVGCPTKRPSSLPRKHAPILRRIAWSSAQCALRQWDIVCGAQWPCGKGPEPQPDSL